MYVYICTPPHNFLRKTEVYDHTFQSSPGTAEDDVLNAKGKLMTLRENTR